MNTGRFYSAQHFNICCVKQTNKHKNKQYACDARQKVNTVIQKYVCTDLGYECRSLDCCA